MRYVQYIILLGLILSLSACVSTSYEGLESVSEKKRPLYQMTDTYITCSINQSIKILETEKLSDKEKLEQELSVIADSACKSCGKELDAYGAFILDRTKDTEYAKKSTSDLYEKTKKDLVDFMLTSIQK
jgi:hypothetical protein